MWWLIFAVVTALIVLFVRNAIKNPPQKPHSAFVPQRHKPAPIRKDAWIKPGLSIDTAGERFAVAFPNQKPAIFKFDELVAVEIERDGRSVTKTNRGNQVAGAAVGALLLGPAGLLLGGLTGSKRQEEKIKRIALKIYTNHIVSPIIDFAFLNSWVGLDVNSFAVKGAAQNADQWYGRFRAILHEQEQARALGPTIKPAAVEADTSLFAGSAAARKVVEDAIDRKTREAREQALLASIEHRRLRRSGHTDLGEAPDGP